MITGIVNLFHVFFPASLFGVLVFWSCIPSASASSSSSALCHTHNFVKHNLSHTTLSNTIFHTQLCQTQSFTHNLSHTQSFKHLLSLSSLPRPASTSISAYWKKLTCGVIQFFSSGQSKCPCAHLGILPLHSSGLSNVWWTMASKH